MISLKAINEDNFEDAFNLKLAKGQEEYVSHPVRSLAQAYVYCKQPLSADSRAAFPGQFGPY